MTQPRRNKEKNKGSNFFFLKKRGPLVLKDGTETKLKRKTKTEGAGGLKRRGERERETDVSFSPVSAL